MTSPPTKRRSWQLPVVFYAHPFELALGIVLLVNGTRGLLSGDTSPAVNNALPESVLLAYAVLSIVGGAGLLLGLRWRAAPVGRGLERLALWVMCGVYSSYVVVLFATYPASTAWATGANGAAIATACLLRERAIAKTQRVILATQRATQDAESVRRLVDGRPPRGEE